MRPIPGTITDPSLDRLWRDDEGRGSFDPYGPDEPARVDLDAPRENTVRLSRRECAYLIEAALRLGEQHLPEYADTLVAKLWACYEA